VDIFTLLSLEKFVSRLYVSDQKWDSIRRIPYSTPGRWVQSLDISEIVFAHRSEEYSADSMLTKLFPLLPFLMRLTLNAEMILSNRAFEALRCKDGVERLRTLKGLKVSLSAERPSIFCSDDSVIALLRCCEGLEELEMVGPDDESIDQQLGTETTDEFALLSAGPVLHLSRLKSLSLLTISCSPLLSAFLRTPLPSLKHLMITPYDDSPSSPTNALLSIHGTFLSTLHLNTPKHWPTAMLPTSVSFLMTSPSLKHLALDYPLPTLVLPLGMTHPLQVLTIPRPNPRFLRELESLLPRLPQLSIVRAKNVRWLQRGMSGKALEAGVQGEMREWRRRLGRRGVRVLDGEWREPE